MKKRNIAVILCLCLLVTLLSSCKEKKTLEIIVDNTISNATADAEKTTLKTISYNVKNCDNGKKVSNIAYDIIRRDADVVCVQEIDFSTERSEKKDVLQLLAKELGMNYCFYPAIQLQGGLYGVGILSKYKLENCKRISLEVGKEEGRVLAQAQITVAGKSINIFNTHLSYESKELRTKQMKFLNETLLPKVPYVLAGDFNIESFDEYNQLEKVNMVNSELRELSSYIGNDGTKFTALDNIICSSNMHFISSTMGESTASDHNYLYGEIEL